MWSCGVEHLHESTPRYRYLWGMTKMSAQSQALPSGSARGKKMSAYSRGRECSVMIVVECVGRYRIVRFLLCNSAHAHIVDEAL